MRIGLTGGIGSGKSTVAAMLGEAGATVIDTDAISRQLTAAGGAAMAAIAATFGAQAVSADGALDRTHMRERVFADTMALDRLEAILHPLISAETQVQAAAAAPGSLIVFDVPLLVESGRWRSRVDRVLVIDCEPDTQRRRVMQRPGWNLEAVDAVLRRQASRQARRAAADAVIHNEALGLGQLRQQVLILADYWRALGAKT